MGSEVSSAYPHAIWRLIVDGEAGGAANMARDEAILNSVVNGTSSPTLRLYAWSPPCLSLGRSQRHAEVDLAACRAAGIDVVRRPTGGRAILHTDELTYSVSLLQTDPRAQGGIVESYRRLSEGLLAGLRSLGMDAIQAAGQKTAGSESTAVCFETPSDYELTVAGRKLVGSAQWRARGGVLQHGTLPLRGDLARIVDYLSFSDDQRRAQRRRLHLKALTIEEAIGASLPFDRVAQALAQGFAQALNLTLVPGELASQERAQSAEIRDEVYANPDWTARV